jgi:hypothetical protein
VDSITLETDEPVPSLDVGLSGAELLPEEDAEMPSA